MDTLFTMIGTDNTLKKKMKEQNQGKGNGEVGLGDGSQQCEDRTSEKMRSDHMFVGGQAVSQEYIQKKGIPGRG